MTEATRPAAPDQRQARRDAARGTRAPARRRAGSDPALPASRAERSHRVRRPRLSVVERTSGEHQILPLWPGGVGYRPRQLPPAMERPGVSGRALGHGALCDAFGGDRDRSGLCAGAVLREGIRRYPALEDGPDHSDGDHAGRRRDRFPPDLRQRRRHADRALRIDGGGRVEILSDPIKAFIGLIALDVWEWTPLIFLILLRDCNPCRRSPSKPPKSTPPALANICRPDLADDETCACGRDRAQDDRCVRDIRSGLRPDTGGPGTATKLISLYGYEVAFTPSPLKIAIWRERLRSYPGDLPMALIGILES